MNAFHKDIWRALEQGKKSFFAIIVITILGVAILSGLRASCVDLRKSASRFFQQQGLHDFQIQSTLGLTDEDVKAVAGEKGISAAEGIYSQDITMETKSGSSFTLVVQTLGEESIDVPYIVDGRMPKAKDEAVLTEKAAEDAGLGIGDKITIPQEDASSDAARFTTTEFTIVGIAIAPSSVNNPFGSVSYRDTSTDADKAWILSESVDIKAYTAIVAKMEGSGQLFCYGDAYTQKRDQVKKRIEEDVMERREKARTSQLKNDAQEKVGQAKEEASERLEAARQDLADGQSQLDSQLTEAKSQLDSSTAQLSEGWQSWKEGKAQLDAQEESAYAQIASGKEQLSSGSRQLAQQEEQLEQQLAQVQDGEKQLEDGISQAQSGLSQVQDGIAQVQAGLSSIQAPLDQLQSQMDQAKALRDQLQQEYDSLPSEEENSSGTQDPGQGSASGSAQEPGQGGISSGSQGTGQGGNSGSSQGSGGQEGASGGKEELAAQIAQQDALIGQLEAQLSAAQEQAGPQKEALEGQLSSLQQQEQQAQSTLEGLRSQLSSLQEKEGQVKDGLAQIQQQKELLAQKQQELADQEAEAGSQFASAESALEASKKKLVDGQKELESGTAAYEQAKEEGEQQLSDGWDAYYQNKQEAEDKINDAQDQVDSIENAVWYVQDRDSLSGYSSISIDADSIESLAAVFPIVFFLVAILVSLTTITRIVDEDRGIIGIYKALGFTDGEIRKKYMVYAFSAAAIGSVLGTVCAFFVLPYILFTVFKTMYLLPHYEFHAVPLFGLLGPALFIAGILLAARSSCQKELRRMPAELMRPKSSKAGTRVFLERMKPVWSRMGFLGKVTARNLFRYKKRMLMTVFGIAGCMALLIFGFAVKDSVSAMRAKQYGQVYRWDLMAVSKSGGQDKLMDALNGSDEVKDVLPAYITTAELSNSDGKEISVQVIVPETEEDFSDYITLGGVGKEKDSTFTLEDGKIYVTHNAGRLLGLSAGSSFTLQLPDLSSGQSKISGITENYLGNSVYMTKDTYEQLFGETWEANGVLAHLSSSCKDPQKLGKSLEKEDGVMTVTTMAGLADSFRDSFKLLDMVVYVLIVMSAGLAFAVLFTLSTTNVSERVRELATIKVLGFYDSEVHAYLNRETFFLTFLGILGGLPLGWALSQTLVYILHMPAVQLQVSIRWQSLLYSAALTMLFAFLVSLLMDRVLDRIDPASALKSVE